MDILSILQNRFSKKQKIYIYCLVLWTMLSYNSDAQGRFFDDIYNIPHKLDNKLSYNFY